MKTRQDNDLTDHKGAIYAEYYIELSGPIRSSVVYMKTIQNNDVTDLIGVVYARKETKLS